MIDLAGYHVLVTGGSRGIGAAAAKAFARAGATVLIHYREREDEAKRVLDELHAIATRDHRRFPCDFMEPSEIQELFQFVGAKWGKLDCLVNNAGVWVHNPLNDFDEEKMIASLRINLRGPFLCTIHALPYLRLSTNASIVNLASTAGQRGEAYYSPYAASKGAIIAATKSWAVELAPSIRVNCVAPGWVDTEMSASVLRENPGLRGEVEAQIPTGRVATADDIAGSIVFLASPLAAQVNGEVVNVNGGSVLCG